MCLCDLPADVPAGAMISKFAREKKEERVSRIGEFADVLPTGQNRRKAS